MSKDASQAEALKSKTRNGHIQYPLWFGGSASCFAACVTHPLDLCELGQHHGGKNTG
jgi:solute carrier family 25 (mitochondrial dicarboxylate transporter), member 10